MITLEKIFFPGQITQQTQIVSHRKKHYLTLSASIWFDYKKNKVLIPTEVGKLRGSIVKALVEDEILPETDDKGFPKVAGEWILYGECYPKTGGEKGVDIVSVDIAGKKKEIAVFGERHWVEDVNFSASISDPKAFDVMPINPKRAYGGEQFAVNPGGIGDNKEQLPYLEYMNALIVDKGDAPTPAFFCATDPLSSLRKQYMGTCDKAWYDSVRPAYPDDMDWQLFQCAPEDQRIDGFFVGDESFTLSRLHPEEEEVKGNLPNLVARIFYTKRGSEQLQELTSRLDTLVFHSTLSVLNMTWRAVLEVSDDDASEIDYIVMAYENRDDARRPISYYQKDFIWRKKEVLEENLYHIMITGALVPEGERSYQRILFEDALDDVDPEHPLALQTLQSQQDILESLVETKAMQRGMDSMRGKTQAQAETAFKESHQVEGFGAASQIDKKLRQLEERTDEIKRPFRDQLRAISGDRADENPMAALRDMEIHVPEEEREMVEEIETVIPNYIRKPLRVNADFLTTKNLNIIKDIQRKYEKRNTLVALNETRDKLEAQRQDVLLHARDRDGQAHDSANGLLVMLDEQIAALDAKREALLNDEQVKDKLPRVSAGIDDETKKAIRAQMDQARQLVETIDDATVEMLTPSQQAQLKQAQQMLASDQSPLDELENMDSEDGALKLNYRRGAHLLPEGLAPHDVLVAKELFLTRWQTNNKNVAHCDYACVDFSGMDLSGSNFSGCYLEQANFSNCNLQHCNFTNAIMPRAILDNANLSYSDLRGANIGYSRANNAQLVNAVLDSESCMSGVSMRNSVLDGIRLDGLVLNEVDFRGSKMRNCILENLTFYRPSLYDTDFSGSSLSQVSLFSPQLGKTNFSDTTIHRSDFVFAVAQGALFDRSRISNFVLMGYLSPEKHGSLTRDIDFHASDNAGDAVASNVSDQTVGAGMSFHSASLESCYIANIDLSRSSFSYAAFDSCYFFDVILRHCDFSYAIMPKMILSRLDCEFSTFEAAQMMDNDLSKTNLRSVNLRRANLFASELIGSHVGRADFTAANLGNTLMRNWRPGK